MESCNSEIILITTANCLVSLQSIFFPQFKPTMDSLVDYTNPLLASYRSSTHDTMLVYGFIPDRASSGVVKTTFMLEDGQMYAIDSLEIKYLCHINYMFKRLGCMVRLLENI